MDDDVMCLISVHPSLGDSIMLMHDASDAMPKDFEKRQENNESGPAKTLEYSQAVRDN